jgi:hypothetical protein
VDLYFYFPYTVMRRITALRPTTDRIYDGGPIVCLFVTSGPGAKAPGCTAAI